MQCAPVGRSRGQHRWQEPETLQTLPEQVASAGSHWGKTKDDPGRPALPLGASGGLVLSPVTSCPATGQANILLLCSSPPPHTI